MGCSDALGGLAQLNGRELDATTGVLHHARTRAELFAKQQLEPWFEPGLAEPDLACRYRDSEGRIYKYYTSKTLQQMIGPDDRPLYQRVTGVRQFQTPLTLPNWPAAVDGRIFGLNPEARYALVAGQEDRPKLQDDRPKLQVVELPENVKIVRYESNNDRTILALAPIDDHVPREGKVTLVTRRKFAHLLLNDRPAQLPEWQSAEHSTPATYDVVLPTIFVLFERPLTPGKMGEPLGTGEERGRYVSIMTGLERGDQYKIPFRGTRFPVPGQKEPPEFLYLNHGSECELTLDYVVDVPPHSAVEVYVKNQQKRYGNGVMARIYLNGRPVHAHDFGPRRSPTHKIWDTDIHLWHIPLDQYAGQPLAVTIASDSKNETNADHLLWTRPRLVNDAVQKKKFVRVTEEGEVPEITNR